MAAYYNLITIRSKMINGICRVRITVDTRRKKNIHKLVIIIHIKKEYTLIYALLVYAVRRFQ